MPPFREAPIEVNRKFDGAALKMLRDIGHEHQINVVDASYDIPEGARIISFPGSSVEAVEGIVRLIPIEDGSVTYMAPDPDIGPENPVAHLASQAFRELAGKLENVQKLSVTGRYRQDKAYTDPNNGFYSLANNSEHPTLFVKTIDDLPFACAALLVGHSQRTE